MIIEYKLKFRLSYDNLVIFLVHMIKQFKN